ncbi:MAG: S8 family serine peptidase [Rhodospirillaceae bacterium]|nr:S8 family serine peptidase [Rhodospirillaceae bacterium]
MTEIRCKCYFRVSFGGGVPPFTVMIDTMDEIDAARSAIEGGANNVNGKVIVRRAGYNGNWKFHFDPASVFFSTRAGGTIPTKVENNPHSYSGQEIRFGNATAIAEIRPGLGKTQAFTARGSQPAPWNVRLVRARQAMTQLRARHGGENFSWGTVKVGHIDTGYVPHAVFGAWTAGTANAANRKSNSTILWQQGRDFLDGDDDNPEDTMDYRAMLPPHFPAHGLRTGSVLAGRKLGVAPGLPLVPYRALRTTVLVWDGAKTRVAQAINAANTQNCPVINMSLGGLTASRAMGEAVDKAYDKGIIICAAAGQATDQVTYPGRYFRTIGVGGVQPKGMKRPSEGAALSNIELEMYDEVQLGGTQFIAGDDQYVDIWAPSACIDRAVAKENGALDRISTDGGGDGTSDGTVHVAAAAAMWLRWHGADLDTAYDNGWKRVEAFRKIVHRIGCRVLELPADPSRAPRTLRNPYILDIKAVLDEPLPQIIDDDRKSLATDQRF